MANEPVYQGQEYLGHFVVSQYSAICIAVSNVSVSSLADRLASVCFSESMMYNTLYTAFDGVRPYLDR